MIKLLTADERKALMATAIDRLKQGEVVDLIDASGCGYALCIGDFRDNGMSVKNTWRTGMNWTWNGPGRVNLHGQILGPGEDSEEIEMDWS